MPIWDDASEIRAKLTANGVRAITDPRRIDPPCVLVVPQSAEFDALCPGEGTTVWNLHCIGPVPGGEDALKALSQIVAAVLGVYPDCSDARLGNYRADTGDPWPVIEMTLRTVSSWA